MGRAILTSNTHIFDWPDDCVNIINVFDTLTNATAITDATNASPINVEAVDHGYSDDDIVLITGVLGNTAANGTFKVTVVDDDNFTLNGSSGNAAYTSGGYTVKWSESFMKLRRMNNEDQSRSHRYRWYPHQKSIVVDYIDFSNDLVIDYSMRPDAITDIPEEYHMGLVAFNVTNLLKIPTPESDNYADLTASYSAHSKMLNNIMASIQTNLMSSTEPVELTDTERWDII